VKVDITGSPCFGRIYFSNHSSNVTKERRIRIMDHGYIVGTVYIPRITIGSYRHYCIISYILALMGRETNQKLGIMTSNYHFTHGVRAIPTFQA